LKLATKGILSLAAITAATSTIALTGISPANAFVLKFTSRSSPDAAQFGPAGGATVIDFNSLSTGVIHNANLGGLNLSTTGATSIGDDGFGDKSLSIGRKPAPKLGSVAQTGTATFSTVVDKVPYLGLFWSAIKPKDTLVLSLFKGNPISYTGKQISDLAHASSPTAQDFYINFYESDVSKRFTSLKITSTGSLVDNVAYRVPTPALLPGLIGMGIAAFRKRKSEESDLEATETAKA